MSHQHLAGLTAVELKARYAAGDASPVEVVTAILERISVLDRELNSFRIVLADEALACAKRAERALLRGDPVGVLHGVPLGIKDAFDLRGAPTTAGSSILGEEKAEDDAPVIRALKAAGAIILGKHNMHEFAFGVTNENPHHGAVRNPWDRTRIAGGSSGGTAAATAAGFGVGGLGTDTSGSVRIPGALCGVVGLKPTYGYMKLEGVVPLSWSLDHGGVLARSVGDVALMLQVVANPHRVPSNARIAPGGQVEKGVRGLRLGVPENYFFDDVDPGVEQCVRRALVQLEAEGARLIPVTIPRADDALACLGPIVYARRQHSTSRGSELATTITGPTSGNAYCSAPSFPLPTTSRPSGCELVLRRPLPMCFVLSTALVTPTVPVTAPPVGDGSAMPGRFILNRYTLPANLTGLPAITLPCGLVEGLPVGIQFIGRPWDEATILRIAATLEAMLPSFKPPLPGT